MANKRTLQNIQKILRSKILRGVSLELMLVFFAGTLVYPLFQLSVDVTSSNEFCSYCHLKMDTVVQEYQESVHFSNRLGIKADCKDCHIPNEFIPAMEIKIKGLLDTYVFLTNELPLEEFETRRWHMFETSLESLRKNKSSTCINCHNVGDVNPVKQTKIVARKHSKKSLARRTCVDCHTSVAHKMPDLSLYNSQ